MAYAISPIGKNLKNNTNIILGILLMLFSLSVNAKQYDGCTIEIESSVYTIDGEGINPGDVVCLLPGNKDFLLFRNIQGTAANPIIIQNAGGSVIIDTDHFYGIKFDNCKYIIFSGGGYAAEQYGIKVLGVSQGAGLSIDNMSTNIEVEKLEIANTAIAGIYAKTEPYQGDCNNLITRDKFTMYDLKIHDCYLHDIADEGFYVGSSKYTGQTIQQCNNIVVLPHLIEGVQIYNNIVERTGWDGIQVSSAISNCSIYQNNISHDSYSEDYGQMSGIIIGGGSRCDCYNNSIFDGKGDGIDVFGMGNMKIFNNLIVRAGRTFQPGNSNEFRSGIYIGYVEGAFTPGATFGVYNNTIVSPKSFGVTYNNQHAEMGYIKNNLITDPGYYSISGNDAFVNLMVSSSIITQSNNFSSVDNSLVKFIDYNNDNYQLQPNSPAVNYGTSLTSEGITFDIDNEFRPFHTYFDAGAYESHDPHAAIVGNIENEQYPYPIPASDFVYIPVNQYFSGEIILTSVLGDMSSKHKINNRQVIDGKVKVSLSGIPSGRYIVSIVSKDKAVHKPIIVVKHGK